jgi:hypothetical protein
MFMMPALPSASNAAPGVLIISMLSMDDAGI